MEQEFSEFRESDKSLSMNWAQFKDHVLCRRWVAGSNSFIVMTNIFVTEFAEFSENI